MRTVRLCKAYLALCLAVLAAACTQDKVDESPKFDPAYVASQADQGNLKPLTELLDACSAEVKKKGKRDSTCATLDKAYSLRKPITPPRF